MDTHEADWWRRGVRSTLSIVQPLIEALASVDECRLSGGTCQEHLAPEPCPDGEAQRFLEASDARRAGRTVMRGVVAGAVLWWHTEHRPAGLTVTEVAVSDVHPTVRLRCVQCGEDVDRG
jgi:hypothetical protein